MKFWILTHHLKGIFLSFQKIINFLILDQRYKLWLLKDVELYTSQLFSPAPNIPPM